MMYFMHIGWNEEPAKNTIDTADGDIGVMKLGGEKHEDAVDNDVPGL